MALRSELLCPVFGHGRVFKPNVLSSYEDVILCYLWISKNKKNQFKNLASDTSVEVSQNLLDIWKSASIPTIEPRSVVRKIKQYHDKYRTLLKPYKSRKDQNSYQEKIQNFRKEAQFLFDIASCKCENFDSCRCAIPEKVPILERLFLTDQRTVRKMGIGGTDVKNSMKLKKKMERKRKKEESQNKKMDEPTFSGNQNNDNEMEIPSEPIPVISSEALEEIAVPKKLKIASMATVANTADRYGISDRAAAALVTATLQDVGLVTKDDLSNVVDRNKIRRFRTVQRNILSNTPLLISGPFALYFDGRKDKTYTMVEGCRKITIEEHISLVKEPNSEYFGHITVESGKAKMVSMKIKEFLDRKSVDNNNMVAVGCDGTVLNTGFKGGVIRYLEESLQKPLQWFICQLHANELPLRHLFEYIDGSTSGPKSFNGEIGKKLKDCEKLSLVNYEPIIFTLPDISSENDLSTDQKYLFDICSAIISGHCNDSLKKKNPGKIVHSRWLTMANRILRLYVSTSHPSENLMMLVHFIVKLYAPMWFEIKTKPSSIYGSKHLHSTIVRSRYLPENLKKIVDSVIQRNGFFGHPENMLLAMLADERMDVKVLALEKIIKSRETPGVSIRFFKIPKFNFSAKDYTEMINWNDVTLTEPPLVTKISTDVLNECKQSPQKVDALILSTVKKYPCHTQATERCVKLVTESSTAVCGETSRDGFIRVRLESRKVMPKFNSKKDYSVCKD